MRKMSSEHDPLGPVVAFFDVDGTMTFRDGKGIPTDIPTSAVCGAIGSFASSGGVAIVSSGRAVSLLGETIRSLPFRGIVALDGLRVILDGDILLDEAIPRTLVVRMVDEMCRVGMRCLFQSDVCCVGLCPVGDIPFGWRGAVACNLEEMLLYNPALRFSKVDFMDESLHAYRSSGLLCNELAYYDVGEGAHELVPHGRGKGTGARVLIDELTRREGRAPARIYAFGDSENDLSIFEVADISVAMGQASARVREKASYVTLPASQDGLVAAMRRLGLI